MTVLLSGFSIRSAKVRLLDFGGELTPGLGGVVQRINRLGSRHAIDVMLPPIGDGNNGRILTSKLRRAKEDGALYAFPQPGVVIGAPGTPLVNGAVTGGSSVAIKGLNTSYVIREGQYFSVIHSSRRYLYSATADATADGSGHATVSVFPLLRTPLANNDVVEIAAPMIEGLLSGDLGWDLLLEPYMSIAFTISESE